MPSPFREIEELAFLGRREVPAASTLALHHHAGHFELVCVEKGKATWRVGRTSHETGAGDVFHTRPGEIHGGAYDVIEPCSIWWFLLRVPDALDLWIQNDGGEPGASDRLWLQLPIEEGRELAQALWRLPRVVRGGHYVFDRLERICRVGGPTDALAPIRRRAELVELLIHIAQAQAVDLATRIEEEEIRRVIDTALQYPDWRPSVAEMAAMINVSPSHFFRLFRSATGMSPIAYLERQRIKRACELLASSTRPITELASDLGYATSQHFARSFRKVTGRSPSEWRISAAPRGVRRTQDAR